MSSEIAETWKREQAEFELQKAMIALEKKYDIKGGDMDDIDYWIDLLLQETP